METAKQVKHLINDYLLQYPFETNRVKAIKEFVSNFDGADLIDRKNFVGHITASVYVLNYQADAIALLKHKFLNKWLQPGGHIEFTDNSILDAALRELEEEMGIQNKQVKMLSKSIFDVDSHMIPDNKNKAEPSHYHHDISFLFQCRNPQEININEHESIEAQWINFSGLNASFLNESLKKKLYQYCCNK